MPVLLIKNNETHVCSCSEENNFMKITSEHIGGKWMVTIKVDHYVQGWVNTSFKQALIVAHAKLLNQMGANRQIIISPK